MIVPEVFGQEPSCVPFVEDKHVIHHVSATAFDPALRDSILPRTSKPRSDGRDVHVLGWHEHLAIEGRVPIQEEILGRRAVGKRLPKLLSDPRRGGMFGDISAEDLAARMADHEEHVEQSERSVGTVNRSMAAIASRWFLKNASHDGLDAGLRGWSCK
jgi:hypothetical protein